MVIRPVHSNQPIHIIQHTCATRAQDMEARIKELTTAAAQADALQSQLDAAQQAAEEVRGRLLASQQSCALMEQLSQAAGAQAAAAEAAARQVAETQRQRADALYAQAQEVCAQAAVVFGWGMCGGVRAIGGA